VASFSLTQLLLILGNDIQGIMTQESPANLGSDLIDLTSHSNWVSERAENRSRHIVNLGMVFQILLDSLQFLISDNKIVGTAFPAVGAVTEDGIVGYIEFTHFKKSSTDQHTAPLPP
jgi:hypothetical protein